LNELIKAGVKPCGLGCRDTLRLEAAMPLHGHEIDEDITPLEAGFQKTIRWENDFLGKEALLPFKDKPLRKLIAFECLSGIARNKNKIFSNEKEIGYVTSGAFSPTLKKAIGLALIDFDSDEQNLFAEIRGEKRKLNAAAKPFYKRTK